MEKDIKKREVPEPEMPKGKLELSDEDLENVSGGKADPEWVKKWLEQRKK